MAPQASTAVQAGPGFNGILEVALGLALVVVVIFAIAWAMRRMVPGAGGGSGVLRVVAALPLGPRERLLLIDAGGKQILIGVTAQQVSTLHCFDEPVVLPGGAAAGSEFATRLREILSAGTRQ